MKIYWFYDWLTISVAEINSFQAKGGGVYASLPMLAIHHGSTVSKGKHRGFEEQQEGYATYFHSFQLHHIQVLSISEQLQIYLYRILTLKSKNTIIKTFTCPASEHAVLYMKFCKADSPNSYGFSMAWLFCNAYKSSIQVHWQALHCLWIQNYDLQRQRL